MAQCKGPYKWSSKAEERVLEREEGVLKEAKFDVTCAGFKGEKPWNMDHKPRNKGSLYTGKAKEIAFLLVPPEETYLCQNLNFSQITLISDS